LLILGDPIKNDDMIDNMMLISLKGELIAENEDITFSDEESETSPKKTVASENNSIPAVKTTPGMLNIHYTYLSIN
jgi:hypothetical protein